jgi:hypothetical protein
VTPLKFGHLVHLYAIHACGEVQDVEVNRADDRLELAGLAGEGESDLRRTGLDRPEHAVRRLEVDRVPDGAALPDTTPIWSTPSSATIAPSSELIKP